MHDHKAVIAVRVAIITLWVWALSLTKDGYFPFSVRLDGDAVMAFYNAFKAAALGASLVLFVAPNLVGVKAMQMLGKAMQHNKAIVLLLAVNSLLSLALIAYTINTYSQHSAFKLQALAAIVITTTVAIFAFVKYKSVPLIIGITWAGFMLVGIISFTVTAKIYDLMPIIDMQLDSVLKAENIYQYYLLDNGVLTQAVRQPGTTLSYLPAKILNIDLRWMNLVYGGALILLLAKWINKVSVDSAKRHLLYLGLAALMIFPYRFIRHDLYEPAYWLILVASIYTLHTKQYKWFSLWWGVGVFVQTWHWLFTPFFAVYLYKTLGLKRAVAHTAAAMGLAGILMALFVLPDVAAYKHHVFEYYSHLIELQIYAQTTAHFTPLLHWLGVAKYHMYIQVLGVACVGALSLVKMRSLADLVKFMIGAMFVFVQFNSLTWNYMYINVLLLMLVLTIIDYSKLRTT